MVASSLGFQVYLVAIALFEVQPLYELTIGGKPASELSGTVRAAHKFVNKESACSGCFSRLYLNFIATLTVSRLVLAADIENVSVWVLVAIIHVFEALFFWAEILKAGAKPTVIDVIIVLNGVVFSLYAASLALA